MEQRVGRKRDRTQSPDRDHKRRHQRRHSPSQPGLQSVTASLPFNARQLTKHDFDEYKPLFTLYLDLQKQIVLTDLDERELKGRWKSFVNKWNRGDLAEGWYEPARLMRARHDTQEEEIEAGIHPRHDREVQNRQDNIVVTGRKERNSSSSSSATEERPHEANDVEEEEEDDFGPSLPPTSTTHPRANFSYHDVKSGASAPTLDNLRYRHDQDHAHHLQARETARAELQTTRRRERRLAKERDEELVPRAEPGTRDRQLEKKRERAASNREFAAAREPAAAAGEAELGDDEVMGGDTAGELARMKQIEARKKGERELRREEILRARKVEREERLKGLREKEDKTMTMLRELARERFGLGEDR